MLIDLYDTLIVCDFGPVHAALAARLGVPAPVVVAAYDATRPGRGRGDFPDREAAMRVIVERCGHPADPPLVRTLVSVERDALAAEARLFPDSLDAVRGLREDGYATVLVSNCAPASGGVVDSLGLTDEFDAVVLSFAVGALKPAAAIYHTALDAIGVDASHGWFVDDQRSYCDGARAVGLATLQIRRYPAAGADPPGGHRVVDSLDAARRRIAAHRAAGSTGPAGR